MKSLNLLAIVILLGIILFGVILIGGCKNMDKDQITINLFEHGIKRVIVIDSKSERQELEKLLTDLVAGSDDMLRLLVDKKRINELKNTEIGVELVFPHKLMLSSKKMGEFEVDKLFIPFSGEFVGKGDDTMSTIFLANGAYISGPLRNSKGLKMVNRLKEIIVKK